MATWKVVNPVTKSTYTVEAERVSPGADGSLTFHTGGRDTSKLVAYVAGTPGLTVLEVTKE